MASPTELKRLQSRKAWLVLQSDLQRRDLAIEIVKLRGTADMIDRTFLAYQAALQVGKWVSPLLFRKKRKRENFFSKLWNAGEIGIKLWQRFQKG